MFVFLLVYVSHIKQNPKSETWFDVEVDETMGMDELKPGSDMRQELFEFKFIETTTAVTILRDHRCYVSCVAILELNEDVVVFGP